MERFRNHQSICVIRFSCSLRTHVNTGQEHWTFFTVVQDRLHKGDPKKHWGRSTSLVPLWFLTSIRYTRNISSKPPFNSLWLNSVELVISKIILFSPFKVPWCFLPKTTRSPSPFLVFIVLKGLQTKKNWLQTDRKRRSGVPSYVGEKFLWLYYLQSDLRFKDSFLESPGQNQSTGGTRVIDTSPFSPVLFVFVGTFRTGHPVGRFIFLLDRLITQRTLHIHMFVPLLLVTTGPEDVTNVTDQDINMICKGILIQRSRL